MKFTSKSLGNTIIRHLREWHRKLGIFAAFFLIFLSLSGIALNHTDSLSLAHSPIKNTWLLDYYGISSPNDIRFYVDNRLVVTDNLVWLDEALLFESASYIVGAVELTMSSESVVAVVSREQLSIFSQNGELIDQLGEESGFPINANAVTLINDMVVIKSTLGILQYHSDNFSWQAALPVEGSEWQSSNKASQQETFQAKLNYRAQYLTLERIIVDAHSGRIFGFLGVLVMDIVAVLLILLSLSGVYIWLRYARSKR